MMRIHVGLLPVWLRMTVVRKSSADPWRMAFDRYHTSTLRSLLFHFVLARVMMPFF